MLKPLKPDFRLEGGEFNNAACRVVAVSDRGIDRLEAAYGFGIMSIMLPRSAGLAVVELLEEEGFVVVDQ